MDPNSSEFKPKSETQRHEVDQETSILLAKESEWDNKCNEIIKKICEDDENFIWVTKSKGEWYPSLKGDNENFDFDDNELECMCKMRAMGTIAIGRLLKILEGKFNIDRSCFNAINKNLKIRINDIEIDVDAIGSPNFPDATINSFLLKHNEQFNLINEYSDKTIIDEITSILYIYKK